MNKLDLKIAFRTFLKGKWYNVLNIVGLALGLAAFIFVTLYVDHETGYDQWNKNASRIYLVERELPTGPSPYTPGLLAASIKSECPEVEETGRMNTAPFQIPFFTPSGRFLIKKWVGADYSIANMLGIKPKGFKLDTGAALTALLSKSTAKALFPGNEAIVNKTVNMMSRSGMPLNVAGVVDDVPGNTNFTFDCIGFASDITSGKDQSYASQIYQTYIMVRPNTDIRQLSKKIDNIYKKAALADTSQVAKDAIRLSSSPAIYLDPLNNLHLKPHYGSQVSNQIVQGLVILAIIILIVTGVNFTNLYVAQANKRSKEVGIKKVNGIAKKKIAFQFMAEIFIQCLLALIISFIFVYAGLPYFNKLLGVNLLISGINLNIISQIVVTLIVLTLLAGIYPAIIMAGFKPADVLRGDQFTGGGKLSWVRGSIVALQFTFAIVFVISLIVINQQVTFMKTEDPGFKAKSVVYIDNLGIYNNPEQFEPVRNRIKAIPGVKNVTVASNVPGGIIPVTKEFTVQTKAVSLNTVTVDYDYLETLNMQLAGGRTFSPSSADTTGALVNEAAARVMGVANPVGASISGCGGTYKIIGIVKDVKARGFEEKIQPAIYLMNDHCGLAKTQIMISAENSAIPAMLKTLNNQWNDINKLDGENFNYHFLDELYGQQFIKQEQLQTVLTFFSVLAVCIAALGFFSSAAHAIRLRMKEVAIRKVFGANGEQIMITLSKPFFRIVLIANVIAWPTAYIIAEKWLQTFAYRVHISVAPFVAALIVSLMVVGFTVCLQIARAVRFNPAVKLKV